MTMLSYEITQIEFPNGEAVVAFTHIPPGGPPRALGALVMHRDDAAHLLGMLEVGARAFPFPVRIRIIDSSSGSARPGLEGSP